MSTLQGSFSDCFDANELQCCLWCFRNNSQEHVHQPIYTLSRLSSGPDKRPKAAQSRRLRCSERREAPSGEAGSQTLSIIVIRLFRTVGGDRGLSRLRGACFALLDGCCFEKVSFEVFCLVGALVGRGRCGAGRGWCVKGLSLCRE